jgi:hypothetical protein
VIIAADCDTGSRNRCALCQVTKVWTYGITLFRFTGTGGDARVKPHRRQEKPPNRNFSVMAGLVPAIHVSRRRSKVRRGWPSPAMTLKQRSAFLI